MRWIEMHEETTQRLGQGLRPIDDGDRTEILPHRARSPRLRTASERLIIAATGVLGVLLGLGLVQLLGG